MQPPALPTELDFPRIKVLTVGSSRTGKSCLVKRYCEGRFVAAYIPTIGIDHGVKKVAVDPQRVRTYCQQQQQQLASSFSATAVRVNFWDVAGGDEWAAVRNEFYAASQGILLVYDVCDRASFTALDRWLGEVGEYANLPQATRAGEGGGGGTKRRTSQPGSTATSSTPAGRAVGDISDDAKPVLLLLGNKADETAVPSSSPASGGGGGGARGTAKRAVTEAEGRQWADSHGCAAFFETSASTGLNVQEAMEDLFYRVIAAFYV